MNNALKYFKNIEDPRSIRHQKHPVQSLIGTTLLASLASIDSFSGFADFTEAHIEELSATPLVLTGILKINYIGDWMLFLMKTVRVFAMIMPLRISIFYVNGH